MIATDRRTRRRRWLTRAAIVSVLALAIVGPFAMIGLVLWAANGSWEFTGGWRYWMLVTGSRLESLGLVQPTGIPEYSVSLEEGNFPGWSNVGYRSTAEPAAIIAAYQQRCRALGFKVVEEKAEAGVRSELTCEMETYLNAEFVAERRPSETHSQVHVRVWGSK